MIQISRNIQTVGVAIVLLLISGSPSFSASRDKLPHYKRAYTGGLSRTVRTHRTDGDSQRSFSISTGASKLDVITDGSYLRLQSIYRGVRDSTPNNPNNSVFTTSDSLGTAFSLLKLDAKYDAATVFFQLRPLYKISSEDDDFSSVEVDEGYLEIASGPAWFFFAGRRNMVSGAGFASNPTDFLGESAEVDRTLPEDERRALRNGVYMLGAQHFFDGGNLSVIVAPRLNGIQDTSTRTQVSINLLLPEINADVGVQALITDERPGLGLNYTQTVGQALVLYSEVALRRGRDRPTMVAQSIAQPNSDAWVTDALFGGSYTFDNSINLILEYRHNSNGYSGSEWQNIRTATDAVVAQTTGPTAPQAFGTLGQYNNAIVDHDSLRRNYGFVRISHPKWPLVDNETSLLWIRNLDDSGNILHLYTEKAVGDSLKFGLVFERMIGGHWDEVGIRPWSWYTAADVTYFF